MQTRDLTAVANLLAVNLCDSLSYVVTNSDVQCIYDAFRLECTNLLLLVCLLLL